MIPMRRLPNDDPNTSDAITDRAPGTFYWYVSDDGSKRRIFFRCPNGNLCNVPIAPTRLRNGATWQWNGNEDAPTLSPSIDCKGCWHGHIRNGTLQNA